MQINHCLALMCDVATYPDRPSSVQIKETHISRVYLTDRYAYKLKKRVQFEFLNFSTPELRHRACLEELRLNRRLAADVYLAVLPITEASDDSLALNGYGQPVDWVVQMRRLPAEQALDVLLYNRRLRPEDWQSIAKHLTDFYTQLQPQPLRAEKFLQDLERRIRANAAALLSSLPNEQLRVHRIHSAQLRYLRLQVEVFTKRVADGHIVEGHGDLRPEHIYVENPPAVIDCIEFSEELRQLDVADELSFLAMECQRLGDGGLGNSVIERYQKSCKDNIPPRLIAFYGAYRACVRAKIDILRGQQQAKDTIPPFDGLISEYLTLADRNAHQLGPPMLLIVGGLMGTGKSTLATELAETFDIDVLSTDHIRHEMLGSSKVPAAYGKGYYEPDMRIRVYDELLRQAGERLKEQQSVLLDGTFLTVGLRDRAYALSYRHNAVPLLVQCKCPRQTAYARIQQARPPVKANRRPGPNFTIFRHEISNRLGPMSRS